MVLLIFILYKGDDVCPLPPPHPQPTHEGLDPGLHGCCYRVGLFSAVLRGESNSIDTTDRREIIKHITRIYKVIYLGCVYLGGPVGRSQCSWHYI